MQDPNKQILRALKEKNEILDNIHEEFKSIVDGSRMKVHSFQEARGISGMKGLHNKVSFGVRQHMLHSQVTADV